MREYNIPSHKFMDFDTPCDEADFPKEKISKNQYTNLASLIKQCKPVQLKKIKDKQNMIEKRAQ